MEVKPREVSSTKASTSLELEVPVGEMNDVRSGIILSSVLSRITTCVSQTEGEAPLPWPVPNKGSSKGVPSLVSSKSLGFIVAEWLGWLGSANITPKKTISGLQFATAMT